MARSVAIVGSGPGGMYAAQALIDKVPGCRVDVIERLAAPFGLIRGGVAPDHQTTKRVERAFEKTMLSDGVRFLGNVEVGRDVSLAELEAMYDAVVLAYGAPHDNRLGIPGEDKANVFGSNAFVGWYNCHPDFLDLNPDLDVDAVAVIGVGNVAVDVSRVLAKTRKEMAATDVAPYAEDAIEASPIRDIYILGRRGPWEAAFTNVELREMGHLENAAPIVDLAQIPQDSPAGSHLDEKDLRLAAKNVDTLRSFHAVSHLDKSRRVHFVFCCRAIEILGGEKVEGLRLEHTRVEEGRSIGTGETFEVPCGLVVTCIGSRALPLDDEPFDEKRGIVVNDRGKVRDRLYAVGWVKRGASGTIGTNKNDSIAVVERLASELAGADRDGPAALDRMLAERKVRVVGYAEWQTIDRLEREAAAPGAPRRKYLTTEAMLDALKTAQAAE